jgi:hypothetical protein
VDFTSRFFAPWRALFEFFHTILRPRPNLMLLMALLVGRHSDVVFTVLGDMVILTA